MKKKRAIVLMKNNCQKLSIIFFLADTRMCIRTERHKEVLPHLAPWRKLPEDLKALWMCGGEYTVISKKEFILLVKVNTLQSL
jgi:hypothetical protein